MPRTRQKTWKLLEKIVPAVPDVPAKVCALAYERATRVLDLELDAAPVAVQHEVQPLAVVHDPLRAGAQTLLVEAHQRQTLAIASETGHRHAGTPRTTDWPSPG